MNPFHYTSDSKKEPATISYNTFKTLYNSYHYVIWFREFLQTAIDNNLSPRALYIILLEESSEYNNILSDLDNYKKLNNREHLKYTQWMLYPDKP